MFGNGSWQNFYLQRFHSDNLLQATERCSIPIILASESKIIVHTNLRFETTICMCNACMDHGYSLPFNSDHVAACFTGRYSFNVFYDVWKQLLSCKSCSHFMISLEVATLTTRLDLQLMDGYIQRIVLS